MTDTGIELEKPASAPETPFMAARWRRFLAYLVDSLILGLPFIIGGLVYFDAASSLGEWGRLVGLSVGLLYFGFFDSSLGGGRTFGKRLLHIAVMDKNGTLLSPGMAVLRALILLTPFYLNGIIFDWRASPTILLASISFLIFGLGVSIIYLFAFNRSRRSLHDLVTGSLVVDAPASKFQVVPAVWKVHWGVVGAFCFIAAALPFILTNRVSEPADIQAVRSAVMAVPIVQIAEIRSVWHISSSFRQGTQQANFFQVIVIARTSPPANADPIFQELENAIFAQPSQTIGDMPVVIIIRYGFTFGSLASAHKNVQRVTNYTKWLSKNKI